MVLKHSVLVGLALHLWSWLTAVYEKSAVHALLVTLTHVWTRLFHKSVIMTFLTREGTLPKQWRGSLTCRLLDTLVNLPAALLHWLYKKLKPMFDGSFFAMLGFAMGDQVPAAIGWLFLGILMIPYKHWDNRYSLMGFALVFLLFLVGGMRRRALRLDLGGVGPYAVCFAGAVCLAWPLSYSSALSFRFLFFHFTCMLCVALLVSAIEHPKQLVRLTGFVCAALTAISVIGFIQRLQGVEVNASFIDITLNENIPGRVFSVFENPNAFAETLQMLIPLAAAMLLCSKSVWGKLGALCSLGFGVVAIGMTYTRASWIGLVVSVGVFVFLWKRKLLPALLLLGIMAIPILPSTIFERILTIFNPKDTSTSSRFPLYAAALELIQARPITGAGLGTDAVRRAVADLNLYHGTAPFVHAHYIYLQVWLETGLLGVLSFLGAMVAGVKGAAKAIKLPACPNEVKLITIGGVSALAGILVSGIADYIWTYPRVMVVFWFVFGLTLAGVRLAKKSK